MAIPVKLPVFEGPLDLLLHLIDKNKVNIYDIPIVQITDQYMEYIRQMEREDLGVVSDLDGHQMPDAASRSSTGGKYGGRSKSRAGGKAAGI